MIRTLTIILCLLCLLSVTSCHSPVSDPLDSAVEPFETAQVVLPSDGEIAIRWVVPPLEKNATKGTHANRFNLKFSVGPEGTPWIGYNDKFLMNPVQQVWFEVLKGYQDQIQLENGAIFLSNPREFGFMVAGKRRKSRSAPLVAVQPISRLPIPNCRMFRGADNCLYFSGLNKSTSQHDVYLLKPENVAVEGQKTKTLKGYEKILSSPKTINAVSGNGDTTYIAVENTILSIQSGVKAAETIFVHPSKSITQLQYNTQPGLFYSTNDTIGYVGKNGHLEFFSRARTQIALNKASLYVFSEDDFGVLAFDHIDALSRMNLHINTMVPKKKRETADEKPVIFAQLGHLDGVGAVAFSPDGKYVISAEATLSKNALVKIWHSPTGKVIRTLKGPQSGANFVTMSPDNKYALTLSTGELKAWDILKGKEILAVSLSEIPVWAAFSPDGKTVSVFGSRTLNIWEISSGLKIKTINPFADIKNMASSNKYAFVYRDKIIYDVTSGKPVKRVKEEDLHDDLTLDLLAFSDDGVYAALGRFYSDTIILRDLNKGTRSIIKTPGKLMRVNISPDGKFVGAIVCMGSGTPYDENAQHAFMVWRFNDSEKIGGISLSDCVPYAFTGAVALSPDWSQVAVGLNNHAQRTWIC